MRPTVDDPLIFSGSASRALGGEIAEYLRLALGRGDVLRFSEGNVFVRVLENVRGRHAYLVQGTVFPANDQFMELLFWIDALKRASAASVTALIPYFSYYKGSFTLIPALRWLSREGTCRQGRNIRPRVGPAPSIVPRRSEPTSTRTARRTSSGSTKTPPAHTG